MVFKNHFIYRVSSGILQPYVLDSPHDTPYDNVFK